MQGCRTKEIKENWTKLFVLWTEALDFITGAVGSRRSFQLSTLSRKEKAIQMSVTRIKDHHHITLPIKPMDPVAVDWSHICPVILDTLAQVLDLHTVGGGNIMLLWSCHPSLPILTSSSLSSHLTITFAVSVETCFLRASCSSSLLWPSSTALRASVSWRALRAGSTWGGESAQSEDWRSWPPKRMRAVKRPSPTLPKTEITNRKSAEGLIAPASYFLLHHYWWIDDW